MVPRQPGDIIISDMEKNLKEPKMHPCARFYRSAPGDVGVGVGGQRNKQMCRLRFYVLQ